jgi:type I restriction enzyme S subunit
MSNANNDDWETVKLSDIAKIYDGTHQTPHYVDKGIPFYSVEHVTSDNFDVTKYVSPDVYAAEGRRVTIQKGDILMTRIGDVGKAKYIDWDVKASFYVSLALIKCGSTVDPKYLTQYINSSEGQREIWGKTLHVAFPNKINLGDIGKCRIRLPSINEQKRIAAVLDDWGEYLKNIDMKIEYSTNIKNSLMQQLLSGITRLDGFNDDWKIIALGDVSKIKTGKKDNQDKVANGAFPFFVRSPNIERIDSYSFDGEAILVPGEGNIGKIFHYINDKFDFHQRVYKISDFDKSVSGKYIHYYFMQNFAKEVSSSSVKATVDSLRLPTFTNFKINLPPKEEQDAIVTVLDTCSHDVELLKRKRSILMKQKEYLANNLISGKIRTPEALTANDLEVQHA